MANHTWIQGKDKFKVICGQIISVIAFFPSFYHQKLYADLNIGVHHSPFFMDFRQMRNRVGFPHNQVKQTLLVQFNYYRLWVPNITHSTVSHVHVYMYTVHINVQCMCTQYVQWVCEQALVIHDVVWGQKSHQGWTQA